MSVIDEIAAERRLIRRSRMKVTLESTSKIVELRVPDGGAVRARIWLNPKPGCLPAAVQAAQTSAKA